MGVAFAFDWEVSLMAWLQAFLGSFGAIFANVFSVFGETAAIVLVVGFFYWCYDKEFGRFIAAVVMGGMVFNTLCKNLVLRRRPYMDHNEIKCLKPVDRNADIMDVSAQGYSFPSGHSTNSVTVYSSLPLRSSRKIFKVIAILGPALVGIARVLAGVHYPTDVLCGWLLGIATIAFFYFLQKKIENRHAYHLLISLLALAGVFYCQTTDYYTVYGLMSGFFLADYFEEKFVGFEATRNVLAMAIRLLGGVMIYFALNEVLKLPFDKEFLSSPTQMAYLVRLARYAIVSFVALGVYPLSFKKIDQVIVK